MINITKISSNIKTNYNNLQIFLENPIWSSNNLLRTSLLLGGLGLLITSACTLSLKNRITTTHSDTFTVKRLAKEILDLNPTIGDAASYSFLKTYQGYINSDKTQKGTLSMAAATMQAMKEGVRYGQSPKPILLLGRALIRDRSGQCDHMAAAVIAKIIEHIKDNGIWSSNVELMNNKGHAFVVINRNEKFSTSDPQSWKGAIIVDTWLGHLGVHEDYDKLISSGENGVILEAEKFARFFGSESGRIQTTYRFSVDELKELAKNS